MARLAKPSKGSPRNSLPKGIPPSVPEGILRYRFLILAALLLLAVASVYGIQHLRADFSFEMIFLSSDEEAEFFDAFKKRFEESSRDIIVLLEGESLFSTEGLTLVQQLTDALEEIDGIDKVVNILNAPFIQGTSEGIRIEPLAERVPEGPSDVEALRKKALANRLFRRWLFSEDGTTLALFARLAPHVQSEKQKRPVVATVRSVADSMVGTRFPVLYSGIPTIQKEYTDQGLRDLRGFVALSTCIVCAFLFVTFRSASGVYLPQTTVVTSVILWLGFMSLFQQKINLINYVVPSLLLVYGIADSIHLIHRYYEELGKGLSKKDALLVTIRHMGVACFMTSFTTAVGFFSLTTATIHIVKTFGLFAGIGILAAYVVTILLLPVLLSLHPAPALTGRIWAGQGTVERLLTVIGTLNERYPRLLLGSGILLLIGSILCCTRINIETFILQELTEDNPLVQANRIMEEEMMGIFSYQIQVASGEPEGALDPDFLARLDQLESFVGSQPWIRKTLSVVDILKEMHQAMHGGDPAFYRVPETRELVAQYLLLYEVSGNQEDIDVLLSPDGSYVRLACQGVDMGTRNFFELKARTEEKATELFSSPASARVTGRSLLAQRALKNVIRDMLVSLIAAFGTICIAVSLMYRSLKVGLVSMVPNVIPLVFTMGFMGLAGITLRTSTLIIFAISLGIAVDDTIHYITRFREEFFRTGDYTASMHRTLRSAGRAIVFTTLIMISGFIVFLSSNFKASQDFGLLASITIGAALLGSLLFLPVTLNMLKPWKAEIHVRAPEDRPD
jgi:predicted RND superfamily exporter protein